MKIDKDLKKILETKKLRLVRSKNHNVYKNDEGLTFVAPATPSCSRFKQNFLRELKRAERIFQQRLSAKTQKA